MVTFLNYVMYIYYFFLNLGINDFLAAFLNGGLSYGSRSVFIDMIVPPFPHTILDIRSSDFHMYYNYLPNDKLHYY